MRYEETVKNVNEVLEQYDVALTLRQIYYRLVADYGLENVVTNYKTLSAILVKARERGEVDDSGIEDRVRSTIGGDWGYDSPERFLEDKLNELRGAADGYTRAMWEDQEYYVEIWIEKDALSRIISDEAKKSRVLTAVARGYSSYTFAKDGADRIQENGEGKKIVILHFGDFDPSGLDMTRDLKTRLIRYGAGDIELRRVALTPEQIRKYKLPPAPAKKSDSRTAKFIAEHGDAVVELDALKPDVLQKLVGDTIDTYVDIEKWNAKHELVKKEREEVRKKIAEMLEKFK